MERGGRRGGGRRGRGRGGGGRGGGRGGDGGGGGGYSREEAERRRNLSEIGDEYDQVVAQRNIKGDDTEEYRQEEVDDDDDEDDGKESQRMTTKFKWEEDTMEEEFNEAGERMEPFNLKGEREEGYFDKTGNFVWRKAEDRTDAWLGSLDQEEDMEAMIGEAAVAKRKREEQEAAEEEAAIDPDVVKAQAIQLMKPGETILQALKRLGPKRDAQGANKKPGGGRASVIKTVDLRSPEEKAQFDQLTECADKLLRSGMVEIYELSYEDIKEAVAMRGAGGGGGVRKRPAAAMEQQSSSVVGLPKQVVRWQYKGADGQIHGPFSTADIMQWRAQGFFAGPTAVAMRFYKEEGTATAGGGDKKEEPPNKVAKRVSFSADMSFSADALAADFDDDDDEEEAAGKGGSSSGSGNGKQSEASKGDSPWVDSDSIDFSLYG